MIDSVKISALDTSISSIGARSLSVRVNSNISFDTPFRPITTREISAKSFLGYRGALESPFAALPVDLTYNKKFESFTKNNGAVLDVERKLQMLSNSTFGLSKIPILQMQPIKSDNQLLMKIAFDMQTDIENMDYVCIPLMEADPINFEKTVVDWCDSAMNSVEMGAVPQLSLKDPIETFSKKLDILCELSNSETINVINLIYADIKTNRIQYAELWRRRNDLKAIVNCSGVPRGSNILNDIKSDLEESLICHGIDSITHKKVTVSPKYMCYMNAHPPKSLDEVDYSILMHNAALDIPAKEWKKIDHVFNCNCPICKGENRDEIINRFAYKDNGEISNSNLRYYSQLHDHQSDQSELAKMRKFIKSNELNEYEKELEAMSDKIIDVINQIK